MSNYSFVVDSTFSPFSMQEMLVPFSAYKDAFEKTEDAYNDLSDKSDKFKYLSETLPEGSKARKLYEGYANELQKQAEDLAHNGLTMGNRRALTSLKRRYQGEIGRLTQADEAMREEKKLRQTLNAQDSSRLYATDNLSIDDFLDNNTPNLYNISGNELYTRGAAAGKAASSRVFSAGDAGSTLGGYYRDYVQKLGYSRETIQKFYDDMSAIPELQRAADSILEERGVTQNLTGYNLQRARKSVINGMIDGAIYQENHSPQRDLGVLTKAEQVADDRAKQQMAITAWSQGLKSDGKGGYVEDPNNINYQTKVIANEGAKAEFNTKYIKDPNTGNYILNPALFNDYQIDPYSGNIKKRPNSRNDNDGAVTQVEGKDLANNDGFVVKFKNGQKHYSYYSAITTNRYGNYDPTVKDDKGEIIDKYVAVKMGEDNPTHKGWGLWSDSNVDNKFGNISASGSSNKDGMHILTSKELAKIAASGSSISDMIQAEVSKYAIDKGLKDIGNIDFQVVAVPSKDYKKIEYLVAFADN